MKTGNYFKILILGLMAIFNPLNAHTQSYEWFENYGSSSAAFGEGGNGITSQTISGESYSWTVGRINGTSTVGGFSLSEGAFIAAFDENGTCVAAKNIKSYTGVNLPANSNAYAIESRFLHPVGANLYITGNYIEGSVYKIYVANFTFTVSGGTFTLNQIESNFYVAKSNDQCLSRAIDVCSEGIFITGRFTSSLQTYKLPEEAGALLTTYDDEGGEYEAFVIRLSLNTFEKLGVMRTISSIRAEGLGIAAIDNSKVCITGFYEGNISFKKATKVVSYINLATSENSDIFIAKPLFSGTGVLNAGFSWAKRAYSNSTDPIFNEEECESGRDVVMDEPGNYVYLTGQVKNTAATFGALGFTSDGDDDAFIAKYQVTTGAEQWVTNLNNDNTLYKFIGKGVDISGEYLYVCGAQFWAKVSTSGVISSVNLMETYGVITGGSEGRSICVNTSDALYYTGVVADGTIIGPPIQTIDCAGIYDVFTAKIYDADILKSSPPANLNAESKQQLIFNPTIITDHAFLSLAGEIKEETIGDFRIYNESGSLVEYIKQIDLNNYTYNCNLDPGFYIYEISNLQGSVFTGKFVKQ